MADETSLPDTPRGDETVTSTPAAPTRTGPPTWIVAVVSGAFGLLYAYAVWNAIAYLALLAGGTRPLNGLGWGVMIFAAAFPIIVFALAFGVGYRRAWWELAIAYIAGLGVVAVFWLNVVAYTVTSSGSSLLA